MVSTLNSASGNHLCAACSIYSYMGSAPTGTDVVVWAVAFKYALIKKLPK